MFLPATRKEMHHLGWTSLDIVLVTGDAYIDSPFIGVAVIGKVLIDAGYRVGIISQPSIDDEKDIGRLGEPELFWGVTAGCLDSMVANYTASKKPRRRDDLTAGGLNNRRPDMALIVYCGLIRRYFKKTRPIVIGGLEASLRRLSHYDYWRDAVRRSVLFDARADILVYGMGEKAILEIADRLRKNKAVDNIRGTCVIGPSPKHGFVLVPPHEAVVGDKDAFREMVLQLHANSDPGSAKGLCQKQDTRYLIHNPPQHPLSPLELDRIHAFDFTRDVHPHDQQNGRVPGIETFRFAVTTHRGCFGQCNFCSIYLHQGRGVVSRSRDSILHEADQLRRHPQFKGIIHDLGGPSANMYGMSCKQMARDGTCRKRRRCLVPDVCPRLLVSHERQIDLLRRMRQIPGVRKVFVRSGLRHDLVLHDQKFGESYLEEIIRYHVSGQLKLAPEHCSEHLLDLMGKPRIDLFKAFKKKYDHLNREMGKRQFLSCYFMAAYPGCKLEHMHMLKRFAGKVLKFKPEQVQIFTPTPATMATLIYHTEADPVTGRAVFVEKDISKKEAQKKVLTGRKTKKKASGFKAVV